MLIRSFFDAVRQTLDRVESTQAEPIRRAAHAIAHSLTQDGILHVFGTGHSHIMAEEIFFRAGGLVQINAILDPGLMLHLSALGSTQMERLEGYATQVLDRYSLRPGDVFLVASNSGRNAGPIEAALYARQKGLTVIALTSAEAYQAESVRHPGGKRLAEVADMVIDTCVPHGDAALCLPDLPERIAPLSTIVGAAVLQALVAETVQEMLNCGHRPKVIVSANVESSQDQAGLYHDYLDRIRHW
jgi:uncharacterized phosphosugar-binding protein